MGCRTRYHTAFHDRNHIVWAPKYRFKVLRSEVRLQVREIIRQVCAELDVTIVNGVLSQNHVHMFVEIPSHVSASDFVRSAHRERSCEGSSISANAIGPEATQTATAVTVKTSEIRTIVDWDEYTA